MQARRSRRTSRSSRIYGAGLNVHGQIDKRMKSDCHTFTPLWTDDLDTFTDATVLFTGWSAIVLAVRGTHLYLLGIDDGSITSPSGYRTVFGDHNGILGTLDDEGLIDIAHEPWGPGSKRLFVPETKKRFAHVGVAGNGHVAAVLRDDEAVVHEFASWNAFKTYLHTSIHEQTKTEPRDEERSRPYSVPAGQEHTIHPVSHKITQLVSNTASFCVLDCEGRVYTWGDNRYGTLTRSGPSSSPQLVDHLCDLFSPDASDKGPRVTKIVAGGWMTGAVRDDGVAFIWGAQMPGTERRQGLLEGDGGYVETTVEIEGESGVLDVLDMTIGEGFVVVVVEGGRLFGVGENGNGQLGEGRMRGYYEDWTEIETGGKDVLDVWAGPKTVYVRVNGNGGES